jgi:signal transduction histidine kinase
MSWITVIWSMVAPGCLVLALSHRFVWWRRASRAKGILALSALLFLGCMPSRVWGQASPTPAAARRVLVIYSDERLLPANVAADASIRATFAAGMSDPVEFHSEFLDFARFPGEEQATRQRDFLRSKYRERLPELIIAGGGPALKFLTQFRASLFSDVPIVYCSVGDKELPAKLPDTKIVGIPVRGFFADTLELALRLQPGTRRVAVVVGSGPRDRDFRKTFEKEESAFAPRVEINWLTDLSLDQLRAALSHLPERTVVLYLAMFQDAAGRTFTPRQALDLFALTSRAPIYGAYDTYLGHGIVGGSMVTFEEIGRKAARVGIRILKGDDPQVAVRAESHETVPIFDWRELQRWKIDEKRLPPGSLIRFREPTFWERHRQLILAAAALIVLEAVLIAILLVQLRRRRRAEESLVENQQDMKLAAKAAKLALWHWDIARDVLWVTSEGRHLYGLPAGTEISMERFRDTLHPEDRGRVQQAIRQAVDGTGEFSTDYRVVLPDAVVRWISAQGRVEFNGNGKPHSIRGVSLDITRLKQSELEVQLQREELAHLSRVATLGELSGALAHELNQPLTAILSNAQAALHFLAHPELDRAELTEILGDIVAADQRANQVIRRLRLLFQKGQIQIEPLDVNEVVQDVLEIIQRDLLNRSITVELELASGLPLVRGDRVQLQQVLLNLMTNAIDAMDEPGSDRRLCLRTACVDGEGVRVTIRDSGHGIPEEVLELVFEPFFTTKKQGLGLGLAVCRTILAAHGSELVAENHPDGGASFHFTLPDAIPVPT